MPQTISTEPLVQMLRSIALQKRTGILRIERLGEKSTEQGEIYFESGRPLRARTGQEAGNAAFQHISTWKQITCSFHSMSRPYPAITRVLTPPDKQKVEENPPGRREPVSLPETDSLEHKQKPAATEHHEGARKQSLLSGGKTTLPLNPRQAEIAISAGAKASISPLPASQPLVLHGTRLEEYTPVLPARPSHAVQRWTTHQVSDKEKFPLPVKSPDTPNPTPLPVEDTLPGRQAVFKVRAMVATAQAIQQMERRARIVFILLDGRRTIQDIARLTHQAEYDVEQILVTLTRRGYTQRVHG